MPDEQINTDLNITINVDSKGKDLADILKAISDKLKITEKQLVRYNKITKQSSDQTMKSTENINKANKAYGRLHGSVSSLSKLKLPAILSAAAIGGALGLLTRYVSALGKIESKAQSLAGSFRDITLQLGNKRDQELFSAFSLQTTGLSRRLSSATEISGLTGLRSGLADKLGIAQATQLTLDLTKSFQGNNKELTKFLAMASVSLPRALEVFQSQDISTFQQALSAVNMSTSEIVKTANILDTAWEQVKQTTEAFVRDFVDRHGGDIQKSIISVSNSIVDWINTGRALAADFENVFSFFFSNLAKLKTTIDDTVKGFILWEQRTRNWPFGSTDTVIDKNIQQMENLGLAIRKNIDSLEQAKAAGNETEVERLNKLLHEQLSDQQDINKANKDFFGQVKKIEPISFRIAENIQKMNKASHEAVNMAKQQRQEMQKQLTLAERMALKLENLAPVRSLAGLRSQVERSRLELFESLPFGFDLAFGQRFSVADNLRAELKLIEQAQSAINEKIKQETTDLGQPLNKTLTDSLNIEKERLNINKQLVDTLKLQAKGYLDAIQSQNFGAGIFEKLIITNDKNLAIALDIGAVKKNPLLGRVGGTGRGIVDPFRFGIDEAENQRNLQRYARQLNQQSGDFLRQARTRPIVSRLPSELVGRRLSHKRPTMPVVNRSDVRSVRSGLNMVSDFIQGLTDTVNDLAENEQTDTTTISQGSIVSQ